MAPGEDRREEVVDDVLLADDAPRDLRDELAPRAGESLEELEVGALVADQGTRNSARCSRGKLLLASVATTV